MEMIYSTTVQSDTVEIVAVQRVTLRLIGNKQGKCRSSKRGICGRVDVLTAYSVLELLSNETLIFCVVIVRLCLENCSTCPYGYVALHTAGCILDRIAVN